MTRHDMTRGAGREGRTSKQKKAREKGGGLDADAHACTHIQNYAMYARTSSISFTYVPACVGFFPTVHVKH